MLEKPPEVERQGHPRIWEVLRYVGKAHAFSNTPAKETNICGFLGIEVETRIVDCTSCHEKTSKTVKVSRVISNPVEQIGNANIAHPNRKQGCSSKPRCS